MERVRQKYGIRIESFFPEAGAVEAVVREYGPNPLYRSIDIGKLCCRIRKVEPLERAVKGMRAWVTGRRREESVTRRDLAKVEIEDNNGRLEINPLADWSSQQVWDCIKANEVPYNALHERGLRASDVPLHSSSGPGRGRACRSVVVGEHGTERVRPACAWWGDGRVRRAKGLGTTMSLAPVADLQPRQPCCRSRLPERGSRA